MTLGAIFGVAFIVAGYLVYLYLQGGTQAVRRQFRFRILTGRLVADLWCTLYPTVIGVRAMHLAYSPDTSMGWVWTLLGLALFMAVTQWLFSAMREDLSQRFQAIAEALQLDLVRLETRLILRQPPPTPRYTTPTQH